MFGSGKDVGDIAILIKDLERQRVECERGVGQSYGSANTKVRRPEPSGNAERERLNIQYWTETVPMVADYNKEHGTDIKPWDCVKLDGEALRKGHPYFHQNSLDGYSIAVAIVYDEGTRTHKPVHVGDPIWIKNSPHPVNWVLFHAWKSLIHSLAKDWTWTPYAPKREFEINGEKFACPEKGTCSGQYVLGVNGVVFGFKDSEERDRVQNTITKLLTDAANK